MFYGEFQNINSTGRSTKGLILIAEIVSCAKRTLARYDLIIRHIFPCVTGTSPHPYNIHSLPFLYPYSFFQNVSHNRKPRIWNC